jgi:hypothetical protein
MSTSNNSLPASTEARLAAKFFEAYNAHNVKALEDCLSEDFKHTLLPRSMEKPSKNKKEWVIFTSKYTIEMIPDLAVRSNHHVSPVVPNRLMILDSFT